MKSLLTVTTAAVLCLTGAAHAQSPKATATASIGGKAVTINYAAPSVRARKIFGDGGQISKDPNYPVWRAGANSATALHTDADLDVGGLFLPKGDYTLYVNVANPDAWELIINKETGQWGLTYNKGQDLGRVKMNMSKPPATVEVMKYTLTDLGGGKGKLELAWESHVASVSLKAK
jgi:opacity protein-like surface antigen